MRSEAKINVLRQSLVFSGLDREQLEKLSSFAIEREYKAGEYVFWEGDSPDWLYIVAQGRVKVLKHSSQGKEFIVAFFAPSELLGEVAVFQNRPYPASAQAIQKTTLLALERKEFVSFLSTEPQTALRIIAVLGERLREAQNRLKNLATERVEQRLASTILTLSSKLGPTIPFTRQELAEMTGTTTETAIRVISRLKDGGIINSERGQITVVDEAKLRLLSEGPPEI